MGFLSLHDPFISSTLTSALLSALKRSGAVKTIKKDLFLDVAATFSPLISSVCLHGHVSVGGEIFANNSSFVIREFWVFLGFFYFHVNINCQKSGKSLSQVAEPEGMVGSVLFSSTQAKTQKHSLFFLAEKCLILTNIKP